MKNAFDGLGQAEDEEPRTACCRYYLWALAWFLEAKTDFTQFTPRGLKYVYYHVRNTAL